MRCTNIIAGLAVEPADFGGNAMLDLYGQIINCSQIAVRKTSPIATIQHIGG